MPSVASANLSNHAAALTRIGNSSLLRATAFTDCLTAAGKTIKQPQNEDSKMEMTAIGSEISSRFALRKKRRRMLRTTVSAARSSSLSVTSVASDLAIVPYAESETPQRNDRCRRHEAAEDC